MDLIDWLAILGALAWTPHLISIARTWLARPDIRVLTSKAPELGFTSQGPIFNLRLAFAVANKDVIVSNVRIDVTHESGQSCLFEWQSITQHMGKMQIPDAQAMPFEKEQSVLAIKLNPKDIEERFIRFQERSFLEQRLPLAEAAASKAAYLQAQEKWEPKDFLKSEELTAMYAFVKQSFPWKPGSYRVRVEIESPERFTIRDSEYAFNLSPVDVERLENNKDLIETDYRHQLVGRDEDESAAIWNWCNPFLYKV